MSIKERQVQVLSLTTSKLSKGMTVPQSYAISFTYFTNWSHQMTAHQGLKKVEFSNPSRS
jgi:hypothetical protein